MQILSPELGGSISFEQNFFQHQALCVNTTNANVHFSKKVSCSARARVRRFIIK